MTFIFINALIITNFPPRDRRWRLSSIKLTCASPFNELLLPLDPYRGGRIWEKKASQVPAGKLCLMFLSVKRHWAKNRKGVEIHKNLLRNSAATRLAFILLRIGSIPRNISIMKTFTGSNHNLNHGWIFFTDGRTRSLWCNRENNFVLKKLMIINYSRWFNLFDRQGIYQTKFKLSVYLWFYSPCGHWPFFSLT
jgi:hypothetical protein